MWIVIGLAAPSSEFPEFPLKSLWLKIEVGGAPGFAGRLLAGM